MFKILLLVLSVQWTALAGRRDDLLEFQNVVDTTKYNFRYKTNSGVTREEIGEMMNPGTPQQEYVVKGRTVNFFPDGSMQIVEYVADRLGYHPKITFLTSAQLRRVYANAAAEKSSTAKPTASKEPEETEKVVSDRFGTDDDASPASGVRPVEQNLLQRQPPRRKPIVGAANRRKPIPYGYKLNPTNQNVANDYDEYDDINNRIGSGTAAALLGIG